MWESLNGRINKGFFKNEGVEENVCIIFKARYYPQKFWLSTGLYGRIQGYSGVIQQ